MLLVCTLSAIISEVRAGLPMPRPISPVHGSELAGSALICPIYVLVQTLISVHRSKHSVSALMALSC
eukprot:1161962-Pelagomonas_calceolata.AAC.9